MRRMRVIILRPWSHDRAFVVVVILIADIPVEPLVQLDRQPRFRRLKTHRIRSDQRSRIASRISDSISLPVVLIDAISSEQRHDQVAPAARLEYRLSVLQLQRKHDRGTTAAELSRASALYIVAALFRPA